MKKPSFTALLYRELLLIKKSLLVGGIFALIFILFSVHMTPVPPSPTNNSLFYLIKRYTTMETITPITLAMVI